MAYDIGCYRSVQNAQRQGDLAYRNSTLIQPVLRDERHWLPICQRIHFEVGVVAFKEMNGLRGTGLPAYSRIQSLRCGVLSHNRSNSTKTTRNVYKCKRQINKYLNVYERAEKTEPTSSVASSNVLSSVERMTYRVLASRVRCRWSACRQATILN